MVRSVEELLTRSSAAPCPTRACHILDPFVGTGNFIVRVMRARAEVAACRKYAAELHCNEVMLLPYYIAAMNIEHAYCGADRDVRALRGLCLVDTFGAGRAVSRRRYLHHDRGTRPA